MNSELRKSIVRLYYLIKKGHLKTLPEGPRAFGDMFVQKEFREHLHNSEPKFMKGFMENWIDYYQQLMNSSSLSEFARHMDPEQAKLLSPEQADTLEKVKNTLTEK